MVGKPPPKAKPVGHFAEPPWNEQSVPWRQIDAQLPPDHLAREMRQAMTHLDLMLAIVLFELRRGQRQPSQWFQDTQENCALWWLGYGMYPSRSCWYEFRDRTEPYLDGLNRCVLRQALDVGLSR